MSSVEPVNDGEEKTPVAGVKATRRPVADARPLETDPIHILIRCIGIRSVSFRRGQVITVGRHSDNTLVLSDGTVSRFHAELRWDADEDRPYIVDLESANGVEVDGEPVDTRAWLSGNNHVDVGDFTLVLQLKGQTARMQRRKTGALLQGGTGPINRTIVRLFSEKGEELKGSFENPEKLREVMLDLEEKERTGTFEVRCGKQTWRTTFSQGLIVTCLKGEDHGEDLLHAMAESIRGSYQFTRDIEPSEECLNLAPSTFFKQH